MATYAIGDVQGCFASLQSLLVQIAFDEEKDTLWFAGDLVNRGPQSLKTLRFVKNLKNKVVVLGNHDLHLFATYYQVKSFYPDDTIQEIVNAPDAAELILWLRQQKLVHYDVKLNTVLSHAGIAPQWTVEKAIALASEVETVLSGNQPQLFLSQMYGNEPSCWQDNLTGFDRLRVITNYFTRMRFCDANGALVMSKQTALKDCPSGAMPWFCVPGRKTIGQNVLFGHWSALQGVTNTANAFALDTGVVWGGPLTAMRLEDGKLIR